MRVSFLFAFTTAIVVSVSAARMEGGRSSLRQSELRFGALREALNEKFFGQAEEPATDDDDEKDKLTLKPSILL